MFNELSVSPVNSREEVCKIMETFVTAYVAARDAGIKEVRLHEKTIPSLYQLNLFVGYSLDTWLQDKRVRKDVQDNFLDIVTSTPLVSGKDTAESDQYSRSEFFKELNTGRHQVWGMGAAYLFDTLSISLSSHTEWDKNEVQIQHYFLNHNADEEKQERTVKHFSTTASFASHLDWFHEWQREKLQKSADLWARRKEFFPHLLFNPEVEKQLTTLGDSRELTKIINGLRSFDEYAGNWKSGGFSYEDAVGKTGLRMSPESDQTLRKFGSLRKFRAGNEKEIFSLHIKLGDTRIYFYPDEETCNVYIGYIGKHLRVVSQN